MKVINNFVENNPKIAQWIREGGLFVIICNLITVFKYLILQFLPKMFTSLPLVDFGFPGNTLTILGKSFKWYIIGYAKEQGGLPYFVAYMIAMVIGEIINFFLQRNITFRSRGNIIFQGLCYIVTFCIITCLVNSINCIWVAVAQMIVPDWLYNVGTTVLNGGISMVIFFFVNKKIF